MNKFYTKERENMYEILFITKKNDEEKINILKEKFKVIKNIKELELKMWKELNPSYRIKDIEITDKALYFIMKFRCGKEELTEIEEILKLSLEIRRYRVINLTKDHVKMKIGKIKNPKPRIKKKTYSKEKFEKKFVDSDSNRQSKQF